MLGRYLWRLRIYASKGHHSNGADEWRCLISLNVTLVTTTFSTLVAKHSCCLNPFSPGWKTMISTPNQSKVKALVRVDIARDSKNAILNRCSTAEYCRVCNGITTSSLSLAHKYSRGWIYTNDFQKQTKDNDRGAMNTDCWPYPQNMIPLTKGRSSNDKYISAGQRLKVLILQEWKCKNSSLLGKWNQSTKQSITQDTTQS